MPAIRMSRGYNSESEYSHMRNGGDAVYLDHAGATIYAKSAVEAFTSKMINNLYGNPHSENSPARLSGNEVDEVRAKLLDFFGASQEHFDLVFVANATAAIKLVGESFRDLAEKSNERNWWYGYHKDSHTSLVGVREMTHGQSHCFQSDEDVEQWLHSPERINTNRRRINSLGLFAYPGQSNMTGRRLPLSWSWRTRVSSFLQNTYTLLDGAALAMTFPMETIFQDPDQAPDFAAFSLYKIFGFPDVGALVIRKQSGHILALRKYFGGGTVSMVTTFGAPWHRSKGLQSPRYKIHEGLEDGTLPFHSMAIGVHRRLYRSMRRISEHCSYLIERLHAGMSRLCHSNYQPVCYIYSENQDFGDPNQQGSTIAFNVLKSDGSYIPYTEVERVANDANIYIRSGGVCNPGGISSLLGYEPWMSDRALSAGHQCSSQLGIGVIHGVPTGIVRASIGAMSTQRDVDTFLQFLRATFVDGDRGAVEDVKETHLIDIGTSSHKGSRRQKTITKRPSLLQLTKGKWGTRRITQPVKNFIHEGSV
ncbi:PLP-dependent transferase [Xylariaceae sp. FL1019]|nr:PLP-dependent transferase [Xylariaceae sp. FL1019]